MANSSIESCPVSMRYDGFHAIRTDGIELQYAGLADTVVVAAGDACIYNTDGAIALGTDGGLTETNFAGIAASGGGSATASANDDTKVGFFLPNRSQMFWAKVETGTAAATDVGEIVDLASEDGVDLDDVSTGGFGFKILAVDTTNNYVKGVFAAG